MLNAKCVKCGLSWNISTLMKIGEEGYICPHCSGRSAGQKKQRDTGKRIAGPYKEKGTRGRRKRDIKREKNARRYA